LEGDVDENKRPTSMNAPYCHTCSGRVCVAAITVGAAAGCADGSRLVLAQQVEARRLASNLRVQFSKAVEASNRAVMADTDEASTALEALKALLPSAAGPQLAAAAAALDRFKANNAELVTLSRRNSNVRSLDHHVARPIQGRGRPRA
jgi:alkylation response protein AidB-like acyl-CoA dehydrogenase